MVMWVDHIVQFKTNGEMINDATHNSQNNVNILGMLEWINKNYMSCNESFTYREGFMDLDLPWFLFVIATDAEESKEPHISFVIVWTR